MLDGRGHALKVTRGGHPHHPVRLSAVLTPIPYPERHRRFKAKTRSTLHNASRTNQRRNGELHHERLPSTARSRPAIYSPSNHYGRVVSNHRRALVGLTNSALTEYDSDVTTFEPVRPT